MHTRTLPIVFFATVVVGGATNATQNVPPDESVISESRINSLRGLVGVYLRVDSLDPQLKKLGLSSTRLREDIESRLGFAGIPVFSEKEGKAQAGQAYLNLGVSMVEPGHGIGAFGVRLALIQNVYLERKSDRVFRASTWAVDVTGRSSRAHATAIRDQVRAVADRFCKQFRAVNRSRPPGGPPVFEIKYDGPIEACRDWNKAEDFIHKLRWDYSTLATHFTKKDVYRAAKKSCRKRVLSQAEFEICVACVGEIIKGIDLQVDEGE